jgi:hypothetical protein
MRIGNVLQIVFFIGFLVTGTVFLHVFHGTATNSELENRALAPFPAFSLRTMASGAFFRQLENYAADHIGFRDPLVRTSQFISSLQGMKGSESAVIVSSNANNTGTGEAVGASPSAQQAPAPTAGPPSPGPLAASPQHDAGSAKPAPDEKGNVQGKVLVLGDRAMNLFTYNAAAGQAYAEAINRIQAELDKADSPPVKSSVLLAPTAAEFVRSAKLRSLSDSQRKAIDDVYGSIDATVTKVDALSAMSLHAQEQIYFRTDHHWTAAGAYYAYAAFMEARGMRAVPLTAYETGEIPDFLGSLYASTLNRQLAAHPDRIVYYKPYVTHSYTVHYSGALTMPLIDLSHAKKKNKYRIFLSGDRPWGHIVTANTGNDRRLAVIKDSYGNALVPFLLPHYSEIFVVDPRQFAESLVPFIREHRIQEILYVNNAEVTMDQGFAEQLRKLANR